MFKTFVSLLSGHVSYFWIANWKTQYSAPVDSEN